MTAEWFGCGGIVRRTHHRARRATLMLMVAAACGAPSAEPTAHRPAASDARADAARRIWMASLDSLDRAVDQLDSAVVDSAVVDSAAMRRTRTSVHERFQAVRRQWKRLEFIAEYYEPTTSRAINGPALVEVEEDEGPSVTRAPEGMQVIEELVYRSGGAPGVAPLRSEIATLRSNVRRLRVALSSQRLTDDRVWDAMRFELARIASVGIQGTDSPIARRGLPDTRDALEGMQRVLVAYADTLRRSGDGGVLDSAFRAAAAALPLSEPEETADRYRWLATALHPLAQQLAKARTRLGLDVPTTGVAFRATAASLFDRDAVDPLGFAPPGTPSPSSAAVALGRRLFADPQLSGDVTQSCASCHHPERAFTDGLARNRSRLPSRLLRNTPTLINAALQAGTFVDLRTLYLEDQVVDVIGSPAEMHGQLRVAADRLARHPSYLAAFREAFHGPNGRDSAPVVRPERIRTALAAYLRSLVAMESRVDRALRGDSAQLTRTERDGLNLFLGKGRCATCHFLPLTNGTVPPAYQRSEVEVLGVPSRAVWRHATVDPDSGRFRVTHAPLHLHAFRTPSLRNVALTAPYMHNGVYRTLDEVVRFYNVGGGAGLGITLASQTLPADSLRLTRAEQRALVALLRALTDTVVVR